MATEHLDEGRAGEDPSGRSNIHLRQHNLSAILEMLHQLGPLPRSVLTSRTGLNRSTISGLVKELVGLGFVVETPGASTSGAGRPSLMVQPTTKIVALSAVVEVDAISVAAFGLSGTLVSQLRHTLPDAPAARTAVAMILDMLNQLRSQFAADTIICGLGVAVPGQVADQEGIVTESFPLHWANVNLAKSLGDRLGMPVYVDNDARIALRSWYQADESNTQQNLIYLDGGVSGIRGAVVLDGELLRGNSGLAGALGLVRVQTERAQSLHEHPGTLDALVRRDELVEALGKDEMSDDELAQAMYAEMPTRAQRLATEQASWLGSGLATMINLFNPEQILLDGFLAPLFETHREQVLERCRSESVLRAFEAVSIEVRPAARTSELLGAAELPLRKLLASPFEVANFRRAGLVALN